MKTIFSWEIAREVYERLKNPQTVEWDITNYIQNNLESLKNEIKDGSKVIAINEQNELFFYWISGFGWDKSRDESELNASSIEALIGKKIGDKVTIDGKNSNEEQTILMVWNRR